MNPKFINVGFHFGGLPIPLEKLTPMFDQIGDDWIKYNADSWILYTRRSSIEIFNILKPLLGPEDQVLIVGLDMNERSGWMKKWVWDWIDKKRNVFPPSPFNPFPLGGFSK